MTTFHSHPATRQDRWVIEALGGKRNGYFIEVGAHDGVHHSNTLTLEDHYGWGGVLIEGNTVLFDRLLNNRKTRLCLDRVIGDGFIASFVNGDSYGGLVKYMPPEWLREHARRGNSAARVQTYKLSDSLDYVRAPAIIDYLSLDAEGSELLILNEILPSRYKFRCFTAEFRYDGALLREMEILANRCDYELVECRAFDACFVHKYMRFIGAP